MSKFLNLFFLIIFCSITYSQSLKSDTNFFDSKKDYDVDAMVEHFEDLICKKYAIEKNDAHLAFKKYIQALNENFRLIGEIVIKKNDFEKIELQINDTTLVKKESLQLLLTSHIKLKQYIWIKEKQNRKRKTSYRFSNYESARIKNTNDILVVNYFDLFSEKLMLDANNEDINDLIVTFREVPSHYPETTATGLYNLKEEDYKNQAIKTFIAFELYYAHLNSLITYE